LLLTGHCYNNGIVGFFGIHQTVFLNLFGAVCARWKPFLHRFWRLKAEGDSQGSGYICLHMCFLTNSSNFPTHTSKLPHVNAFNVICFWTLRQAFFRAVVGLWTRVKAQESLKMLSDLWQDASGKHFRAVVFFFFFTTRSLKPVENYALAKHTERNLASAG
jgi:hypothetical protein